jgi:uncharacterized protein with NRDE domain
MCLISFAYKSHADYSLVVAANRDEYYQRPTAPATFWEDAPQLLAGKDLLAGGTWMGITRGGRFAAITNHRNPPTTPDQPRSRGLLTLDFLLGELSAAAYMEELAVTAGQYAGFNLLLADSEALFYLSNVEGGPERLEPGVYGLSNGSLYSGWPKQELARRRLGELLGNHIDHEALHETVTDREIAADNDLPDTGIGLEMERLLSPQFIRTPEYGTRATTSLWISASGAAALCEKSFRAGGEPDGRVSLEFNLDGRE